MMCQSWMKAFSSRRILTCISFFYCHFLTFFLCICAYSFAATNMAKYRVSSLFLTQTRVIEWICKDSDDSLDQRISYYEIILLEFFVSISSHGSYQSSFTQVNNGPFFFLIASKDGIKRRIPDQLYRMRWINYRLKWKLIILTGMIWY